ncbi:DUF3021 domain-containing protein [Vagococcus sp. JNUCC 83]
MIKKIATHAIKGFPLGISIGLVISIIISYMIGLTIYSPAPPQFINKFTSSLNAMVVSVIIWGLIGVLFSTTSLIFSETDWSITKMTVVHFFLSYVFFAPLSIIAGWLSVSLLNLVTFTVIYLLIYIIYWLVWMLQAKKGIEKINSKL